jgi:hypothetical protein
MIHCSAHQNWQSDGSNATWRTSSSWYWCFKGIEIGVGGEVVRGMTSVCIWV